MTKTERYLFDLQGYLLVKGVLSKEVVARLNDALASRYKHGDQVDDILDWGVPELYDLAVQPVIDEYLEEILGPEFRLDHEYAIIHHQGDSDLHLHGGGTPYDSGQFYAVRNQRIYSGLTVVSYALSDIRPGDGGFCCIPGSHKSEFEVPETFRNLQEGPIVHVPMEAGDALIFTEALTHGTLAWKGEHERRSLLYKFSPSAIAWAGPYQRTPELLAKVPSQVRDRLAPPTDPWYKRYQKKSGTFVY